MCPFLSTCTTSYLSPSPIVAQQLQPSTELVIQQLAPAPYKYADAHLTSFPDIKLQQWRTNSWQPFQNATWQGQSKERTTKLGSKQNMQCRAARCKKQTTTKLNILSAKYLPYLLHNAAYATIASTTLLRFSCKKRPSKRTLLHHSYNPQTWQFTTYVPLPVYIMAQMPCLQLESSLLLSSTVWVLSASWPLTSSRRSSIDWKRDSHHLQSHPHQL